MGGAGGCSRCSVEEADLMTCPREIMSDAVLELWGGDHTVDDYVIVILARLNDNGFTVSPFGGALPVLDFSGNWHVPSRTSDSTG